MAITLNHLLVPAHDKEASALWLATLFGLKVGDKSPGSPHGRFAVMKVGETSLDFDTVEKFEPHHYAFLVDDEAFDRIFSQIKALGLSYAADPMHEKRFEINHYAGGGGLYFRDPNGHNLELLTRTGEEH
ncbi:VOC family protein [Bradyrhizobium sp. WSM 1704]|uniref:VOC family protein n=1 Tax=Bradyrhizobium semiaridum TaxID=2821404 RepID=UPI001CE26EBD|nr:VOC family protein [Bradyrhizobium semiaridum]MCA6124413.1 VOC family protein [Bradyrhizobium semiaridum]